MVYRKKSVHWNRESYFTKKGKNNYSVKASVFLKESVYEFNNELHTIQSSGTRQTINFANVVIEFALLSICIVADCAKPVWATADQTCRIEFAKRNVNQFNRRINQIGFYSLFRLTECCQASWIRVALT